MVWSCDSFAYFIGISIGEENFQGGFTWKSAPKIREGLSVGILCTMYKHLLLKYFYLVSCPNGRRTIDFFFDFRNGSEFVGSNRRFSGISVQKRTGIKDSGKILAGHGGILDRFDSMIFVLPIMYYIMGAVL